MRRRREEPLAPADDEVELAHVLLELAVEVAREVARAPLLVEEPADSAEEHQRP